MQVTLILAFALQTVAVDEASSTRVPLWQTLREGMTVDETAAVLRGIEGIKTVTVKQSRKRPSLSIKYESAGIEVAGLPYTITPLFKDSYLESVSLESKACLSLATEKYKVLREVLSQKYGKNLSSREVTEERELIAVRDTYSAMPTRVMLRLEPGDVPKYIHGATGLAGALAAIANASTDADIEACPLDRGQRATIRVAYLNNANAAAIDAAATAEEVAKRRRDKAKL